MPMITPWPVFKWVIAMPEYAAGFRSSGMIGALYVPADDGGVLIEVADALITLAPRASTNAATSKHGSEIIGRPLVPWSACR